ncbi:MAG: hypothetical protein H6918_12945 [Sphingomonadaceae bacterium]|nr:hypothetical protein [Sphingomonadaceae bacterium]
MTHASGEVGKPLLLSLLIVWAISISAYWILDIEYAGYVDRLRGASDAPVPVNIMLITPGHAIMAGVVFSILLAIHWWLSGLFAKPGMAKMPIANIMLAATALFLILELFESAANDFHNYSLFCRADEPPVVILVDEVHRCARALSIRYILGPMALLLPVISIPVRILESRIRKPTS